MLILIVGVLLTRPAPLAQPPPPLRLIRSIPLDGVQGRIDHMAVDPGGQRLFVAALGNNSVEVADLRAGRRVSSRGGFREPQGVCFVPELNRLFVANGGDGICEMLDGTSFQRLKTIKLSEDADNIRYAAATHRVYIGYGSGALAAVDAGSGESLGTIPLRGHPESFQVESAGVRIYVNVPDAGEIAVVDRVAGRVVAEWPLGRYAANFPMALDEAGHRLFVGCRHPAAVLVYDTRSGQRTAAIRVSGDADDLFYDGARGRLVVACGAGFLDVLDTGEASTMKRLASIPTASGARTALLVTALDRLCLAVPHRGTRRAEIRVFEIAR